MKQTVMIFTVLAVTAVQADTPTRPASRPASPALVGAVRLAVQPIIDKRLAEQDKAARKALALALRYPAQFKLPVRLQCAKDVWAGMAKLEAQGLAVAAAARDGKDPLPDLIDSLCSAVGMPTGAGEAPKAAGLKTPDDHLRHIKAVLDKAAKLRQDALEKMSPETRKFMHSWPANIVKFFGPQIPFNDKTKPLCQNDRAFCAIAMMQCDWKKLTASAKVLASLGRPEYLAALAAACRGAKPLKENPAGVTGDVLLSAKTPHGLIIVAGAGKNTYKLTAPVAALIDLGGDDAYSGTIAAGFDAEHGNSIVIDISGDDTYAGGEFGMATGRVGTGILIDRAGDDTYKLAPGSGGAGFAGIGILMDAAGDDTYVGSKFTQGAAMAGIGLLYDDAGDDKHTSFGFAVGFGGPAGAGALVDKAGNDTYQCGKKYPSGYNDAEPPIRKPGDKGFQYTSFGMGAGMGRRIFSKNRDDHAFSLAGGVGMVIDLAGDDEYDSSNFSQGSGYFFGVGLKLDMAGDDLHGAARYGHAAGAHFGMGLFVDYAGRDKYASAGPTYNCGCAWDQSAFLCIDGGGDDLYDLAVSAGLGRADICSWGLFADLGGNDRYIARDSLALASGTSLGIFYDRRGWDDYSGIKDKTKFKPENGLTHTTKEGAIFVDVPSPKPMPASTPQGTR